MSLFAKLCLLGRVWSANRFAADDPPIPNLGGVGRVARSYAHCEQIIDLADSECFGLCLCVGSWAEGEIKWVRMCMK